MFLICPPPFELIQGVFWCQKFVTFYTVHSINHSVWIFFFHGLNAKSLLSILNWPMFNFFNVISFRISFEVICGRTERSYWIFLANYMSKYSLSTNLYYGFMKLLLSCIRALSILVFVRGQFIVFYFFGCRL